MGIFFCQCLFLHGTSEESTRNLETIFAQAQSGYKNVQREFDRLSNTSIKGYVSTSELDNAHNARDVTYQKMLGAKAELDAGKMGDHIELRQPYWD